MKPQSKQRFEVSLLVHLRSVGGERRLAVDHGGKLLDVDLDRLGGVAGLGEGLGDNRGDRLAHVANDAFGEDRMARLLLLGAVAAGDLPGGGQAARVLKSSPVKTADAGIASAAVVSRRVILPCATSERRKWT